MNLRNSRIEWVCKMHVPLWKNVLRIAALWMFILVGVMALVLGYIPFLVTAALFGVIWFLMNRDKQLEYEFDYMMGDLEIFKISNASRRKKKYKCSVDDISYIWKGLDNQTPKRDYYQDPDKAYTMQVNNSGGRCFIRLEVDERFLELLDQERKLRK